MGLVALICPECYTPRVYKKEHKVIKGGEACVYCRECGELFQIKDSIGENHV